jgi:hypothetical protein
VSPNVIGLSLLVLANSAFAKDRVRKTPSPQKILVSEVSDEGSSTSESNDKLQRKTRSGKKIVKLKNDEVLENSSEARRENQSFSLVFEPIGFIPFPVHGLALGYYLTPSNIIELSYAQGETDFLLAQIENSIASLRLKTFWGNSFYTNIGLGSRMIGYRFRFSEIDSDGNFTGRDDETSMQNTVLGSDFAIGNRWQWESFTIGCDWIGLFSPISTTGETSVSGTNISPSDVEDANETMDRFSKQGSIQFLRFYLGFSF